MSASIGSARAHDDGLAFLSIAELARLLDEGELSSVELVTHTLDRLADVGVRYNAVAALTTERALSEAHAADRWRRRAPHSPLLGVPYGAKDLFAARGAPTAYGSPAFEDQVLDYDASVVRRLKNAGAVLVAKLSLLELVGAYATRMDASVSGPGLNPWSDDRWAGGSSTGSASAVAAGLLAYAIGTETGGSIGCPCAYNGVTGVRPTYGLVSRFGAMPVSWSLDKVGPIARTAADCATVLEAISGFDRADRSTGKRFRVADVAEAAVSGFGRLRIGLSEDDIESHAAPSVRAALRDGVQAIRDLGCQFVPTQLPSDLPLLDVLVTITRVDVSSGIGTLIRGRTGRIGDPRNRIGLELGETITGRTYVDALRIRRVLLERVAQVFESVDVFLTFGEASIAPLLNADPDDVAASEGANRAMCVGNLAGLPALFLPCGLSDEGMPVGIQLVGPPFSEPQLFALGEAFQANTPWHLLRPPVDRRAKAAPNPAPLVDDDELRASVASTLSASAEAIARYPLWPTLEPDTVYEASLSRVGLASAAGSNER